MSDWLPTNEDDYYAERTERSAPRDPLGGMSINDYQRYVGGGEYFFTCPGCGRWIETGDYDHDCNAKDPEPVIAICGHCELPVEDCKCEPYLFTEPPF